MKTLPSSLTRRACLALTCAAVAVCLWSCGKGSSSANKGALPLEIEQMERLKDSDPEKALELYHSFKNGQAEWDDKKKADEKFPGIATAVYNTRLAEEDFQRCGDLFEEVKKTWPSTDLCKTLSSLWARDRVVWFKKAAGARDFETADRLLPEIPLNPDSPSWGEVMPVLPEYMEARWQNASATSDYAAVDKLFTEWLGNPVRSKNAQMGGDYRRRWTPAITGSWTIRSSVCTKTIPSGITAGSANGGSPWESPAPFPHETRATPTRRANSSWPPRDGTTVSWTSRR
jgi:hypothetical protein